MYNTWKYAYFPYLLEMMNIFKNGVNNCGFPNISDDELFDSFAYFIYTYSSKKIDPNLIEMNDELFLKYNDIAEN